MSEAEREARRPLAFVAGLSAALAVFARYSANEAVPVEARDALRDLVRGLEHLERALQEVTRPGVPLDDPFAVCMPKIQREVQGSHMAFVTDLGAWCTDWWAARRAEIEAAERPAAKIG